MLITSWNRLKTNIKIVKTDLARVLYIIIRMYLHKVITIASSIILLPIFFLFIMNFLMFFSTLITNYAYERIIGRYERMLIAMLTFKKKC